jgi:hypothetical protein
MSGKGSERRLRSCCGVRGSLLSLCLRPPQSTLVTLSLRVWTAFFTSLASKRCPPLGRKNQGERRSLLGTLYHFPLCNILTYHSRENARGTGARTSLTFSPSTGASHTPNPATPASQSGFASSQTRHDTGLLQSLAGLTVCLPVMHKPLSGVEKSYYAGCYCCSFDKDRPTLRGHCGFDEWTRGYDGRRPQRR